jgi:hypothetical protein
VWIPDPATLAERRQVACEFASKFDVSVPVLVDTMDDATTQAYSGMPERTCILDAEGKIAYAGDARPYNIQADEVCQTLDKLLGVANAGQHPTAMNDGTSGNADQVPLPPGDSTIMSPEAVSQ